MIRTLIARAGSRLGGTGSVGLALLVLAGGFFTGTLYPEKRRLDELQREVAELRQRTAHPGREAAPATNDLAAFYAFLPDSDELPRILETVFRAAQRQSLVLERGEYRVARRPGAGAMFQYQLTFPVHGSYPQIRKFVNAALTDVPALSLESVHLERQKIGESVVDAKITLAIHLGQKS